MAIILNTENTDKRTANRKYYLVDFSSAKAEGLDGIENLSADDNIIVFFVNGESADFSVLSKLYSCKANVTMKEIENNDLINLVIAVYIGSIINEKPDIYLICGNGGNYAKAVELAVDRKINIFIQQNISGVVPPPPPYKEVTTVFGKIKYRTN